MGIVIIGITFFVQTETVTTESLLAAIPVAIFIGAILMVNNIRDLDEDSQSGRKTLVILLEKTGFADVGRHVCCQLLMDNRAYPLARILAVAVISLSLHTKSHSSHSPFPRKKNTF